MVTMDQIKAKLIVDRDQALANYDMRTLERVLRNIKTYENLLYQINCLGLSVSLEDPIPAVPTGKIVGLV